MFNLKNNIIDVCNNYYNYLLNLQNVSGVGLGFKYINNINTFEPCIHVLVEDKMPAEYITSNNLIPNQYMGLKTDVIKIGKVRYLSNDVALPQKFRPLEGGCCLGVSLGRGNFNQGTLGCIVTKIDVKTNEKKYYILSNNHVLASLNILSPGASILQPDVEYGATTQDIVAHLTTFIELKHADVDSEQRPINFVDCAIAELVNSELCSKVIYKIGKLSGYSKASLGEDVKKVGYVTGKTYGEIESLNVTLQIQASKTKSTTFINQILAKLLAERGDSGSVVVNDSNKAVGLLFSGTDEGYSYINDIELVLNYLNVELYIDD